MNKRISTRHWLMLTKVTSSFLTLMVILSHLKDKEMMRIKTKNPPLDQTGGPREDELEKNPEEPMHTTKDLEEPAHEEFETGGTEDQPNEETSYHPDWFQKPTKLPTLDHDWNTTLPDAHGHITGTLNGLKIWSLTECGVKCWESARDVYSKHRIIAVTKLEIVNWHKYKHLDWITVRKDDDKLNKLKEGKLTNLKVEERLAFNVSLRMFTRSVVIQRRVEDLQLGVKSYQKKLNLTKPDPYIPDLKRREAYIAYSNLKDFIYQNKDKKNRLRRIDELHKFSDGIESYIQLQDYALWEIIEDGNSFKPVARTTTDEDGTSTTTIPGAVTAEQKTLKKNDLKARSILMMTLPMMPHVYAYAGHSTQWSQVVHEDLNQIHEDDLDEMDLKWADCIASMKSKKVLLENCWDILLESAEILRVKRTGAEVKSSRRTVNVEKSSSKAMLVYRIGTADLIGTAWHKRSLYELCTYGLSNFESPTMLMKKVKRLEDKLISSTTQGKKERMVISDTKEYLISEDSVKQGRMEVSHKFRGGLLGIKEILQDKLLKKLSTDRLRNLGTPEDWCSRSHSRQAKEQAQDLKSMITTSNHKLMNEVKDYELKTKVEA
ncbi:hypothetical protein Tco_0578917 [Tanacetum coccineum]